MIKRLYLTAMVLGWLLAACVNSPAPTQSINATQTPLVSPTPIVTQTSAAPSPTPAAATATALVEPPTAMPATAATVPTQAVTTHTVLAGETLFRIALNAGVSVESLRAANNLTGDIIFVGQVLVIPNGSDPTNNPPPVIGPTASTPNALPSQPASLPTATPPATLGALVWDTSPQALIIRTYSDCCEMAPYDGRAYIPEALVWGDGRIIWTKPDWVGGRTLLTGQLSQTQLQELLQAFVDEGFFNWEPNYQTYIGAALRPTHLTVTINGLSKTVTELGGAPGAYYDLQNSLRVGAGALPNPYIPARGYLTANLFSPDSGISVPSWPADTAGFSLAEVGAGRYIEGETLAFVWTLVNKGPYAPVYVQSDGQIYVIMIQIAGLSFTPPPA